MSTAAIEVIEAGALTARPGASLVPRVPWRDPQSVEPTALAEYIRTLELRCKDEPHRPELWTCLGMAHAVNYDVDRSMQALEQATQVEPLYFWGRLKLGELLYRLRALDTAEAETLKAVDLAEDPYQLTIARKQLNTIRSMNPQRVRRDAPASMRGLILFLVALLAFGVAVVMTS